MGVIEDEKEDAEVEKGKEVNQGKDQVPAIAALAQISVAKPILILSSASETANDLRFPKVAPAVKDN